jgi:FtsP/CotA-like multicopper oxidase with cupredoxin domain
MRSTFRSLLSVVVAALAALALSPAPAAAVQLPLKSTAIPKFVDPLPAIPVIDGTLPHTVNMCEFKANVLPSTFVPATPGAVYGGTDVWGYVADAPCPTTPQPTYIGPIVVASRGVPTAMTFVNNLGDSATSRVLFWGTSVDQTLHWADPLNLMCNSMAQPGMLPVAPCNANYSGPIPATVHLHGGEVPPVLDGGPDSWYLSQAAAAKPLYAKHGSAFYSRDNNAAGNYSILTYPNRQEAAPIWFHDHALGATRLNVYAGLAGAYLIHDNAQTLPANLTPLTQVVPLVVQDRMFDVNGQLFFPSVGLNPEHPFWVPEFIGDTIVVNGKAWPYFKVEPKRYRLLFLNGSNARTYTFGFQVPLGRIRPVFWQIGTDGGYLDAPARVPTLTLMPGERADVIVDFSGMLPGDNVLLRNTARAPFPGGAPVSGSTTGSVLQFRVGACLSGLCGVLDNSYNPAAVPVVPIRAATQRIQRLVNPLTGAVVVPVQKTRQLTLNEVMGMKVKLGGVTYPGGPVEILVNNSKWSGLSLGTTVRPDFTANTVGGVTAYVSEVMQEGQTEYWEIVNLTADAHPIHTHLAQFQLSNRQSFDLKNYSVAYALAFPAKVFTPGYGPPLDYNTGLARALGGNPDVTPFLLGAPVPPPANEAGWKDTIMVPPNMVTRFAIRWAPTDTPANTAPALASYPFDTNAKGQGYVWHCHIIDHEDNEMMRPDLVRGNAGAARTFNLGIDY